ncbi:hypothetical protein MA16_Dca010609 [Dendrobium catenatum]|uniref:HMA domain-containing protein n=1 Tax=Dendrobium catenatum TaxID=906689 RepID=A0A2I0VZM5_9ASPA|nr:hypothetical protein MA16_Dca010609 [Dendrobium catenatum]
MTRNELSARFARVTSAIETLPHRIAFLACRVNASSVCPQSLCLRAAATIMSIASRRCPQCLIASPATIVAGRRSYAISATVEPEAELWELTCGIGVTCVEVDMRSSKVTVLGYIDKDAAMKAIRKTGRRAEVWSSCCHRSSNSVTDFQQGRFKCIFWKWKKRKDSIISK